MAAVVVKMEKDEFRAVIKHFYLKKWTAAQIEAELDEVHGDSAPALKIVYFCPRKKVLLVSLLVSLAIMQ